MVTAQRRKERIPIGMLTECDLTMAVLTNEFDPATLTVGDIVATEPFTVQGEDSVIAVVWLVRERNRSSEIGSLRAYPEAAFRV